MRAIIVLTATAAVAILPASAVMAQRQPPTPEQRIERLERQIQEMQRQVFPKGRPADTAGFSDDPAASQSSVMILNQRLDALERQMSDLLRQTEETGNRLRGIETSLGQMRTDQEQRIQAVEQRISAGAAAAPLAPPDEPGPAAATPPKGKPAAQPPKSTTGGASTAAATGDGTAVATDAAEDAYTEGFHLWEAGQYDQAIASLKSFVSTYPKHRRVSYANNLIGRALLDKGQPRQAAEALLSNYRNDPGGERAPDSLYYLGQALMKLDQPVQACKAYGELDAVYGAKIRPDLKNLETDAKSQANCT